MGVSRERADQDVDPAVGVEWPLSPGRRSPRTRSSLVALAGAPVARRSATALGAQMDGEVSARTGRVRAQIYMIAAALCTLALSAAPVVGANASAAAVSNTDQLKTMMRSMHRVGAPSAGGATRAHHQHLDTACGLEGILDDRLGACCLSVVAACPGVWSDRLFAPTVFGVLVLKADAGGVVHHGQ